MRKILLFASAIFATLLVACDNTPEAQTSLSLALESEQSLSFNENGGEGEILYSLTEVTRKAAPATVNVECQAEWITNFEIADNAITFLVEAMDFDAEPRHGIIVVSYRDESFSVNVHQTSSRADYDIIFTAEKLNGAYYGKVGSSGFNYTVTLSDVGVPGRGQLYYNSKAYNIDIFSDVTCGFSCEPQKVPVGVYQFDGRNSGEPGTFMANFDYTYYANALESSVEYYAIIDGTITVTENKIVASLRTEDGLWHLVTYEGDLTLSYDYIADIARPYSRLTGDYNFEHTFAHLHSYFRGDYFGLGYDVWYVDMCPTVTPMNGDYIMLMLMVDKSKGGYKQDAFLGEYTVAEEGMASYANTFVAGDLRNGYEPVNTWMLTCENSMILNTWGGPITDGKINIDVVDGFYVVTVDCVDDAGYAIKGSFRCVHDGYLNQDADNPDLELQ